MAVLVAIDTLPVGAATRHLEFPAGQNGGVAQSNLELPEVADVSRVVWLG
jgi:hypothetical protein